MKKVLLTGFEPFDCESVNPSLEAVKILDGEELDDYVVHGRSLPVTFGSARAVLEDYIDELEPDIVISVGQAGGRSAISVERVAININDGRIPDNNGYQPIDEPVRDYGPTAYWSGLPIKAIAKAIREAGIPAEVSQTAGTYVCNYIFYCLMDILSEKADTRGGFIHIPYIPEQAARHPGKPSLALTDIIKGLRLAIRTAATRKKDIVATGGTIS